MTREDYNKLREDNFSAVKHILESPAKYIAERDKPRTPEDELKFAVGTLVHAMTLEGKNLLDLYAIKPEGMSFATKEGKAWRAAQTLPILKEEDANRIPRMAEAIIENEEAAALLRVCPQREHAITAALSGVNCKGLLDGVGVDGDRLRGFLDLKTTGTSALDEPFGKKIYDFHYDMQLEWYSRLLAISEGLEYRPWAAWIVVETSAPFEVEVYYPKPIIFLSGAQKLERALAALVGCRATGCWPKRGGVGRELGFPSWLERRIEEGVTA